MLLTSLNNYSGAQFAKDVVAGIIVAIIALPLSIALALASGVGPAQGIYTAIVSGFSSPPWAAVRCRIAGPRRPCTIVAGMWQKTQGGLAVATVVAASFW
jgi:SulP family sulfate permease